MKDIRYVLTQCTSLPRAFALVLLLASSMASAQGVLTSTQTGTIQQESQDDGYLVISGQRYGYSDALTTIFLNGEQVDAEVLDEGLVVRYTLNRDGMLVRIELLGPANLLPALDDS